MGKEQAITRLLREWRAGDDEALERLIGLVYETLHELAERQMRHERPDHTLQATALIHEAYKKLACIDIDWKDRDHFYRVAARTMRRVLVDHARARQRAKRGGQAVRVTWNESMLVDGRQITDVIALDAAMTRLASMDRRKGQSVELHYFAGLTYAEVARILGVSEATVDRELRFAKAWLYREIYPEEAATTIQKPKPRLIDRDG